MDILVARSLRSRLVGLALRAPPAYALLIPRCRSVHTFGMRFALDLVWLDRDGRVAALEEGVPPGRLRGHRAAAAVLEAPAGLGRRLAADWMARSRAYRQAALE